MNFRFTISGKLVPSNRRRGIDIRLSYPPDTAVRGEFPAVYGTIDNRAAVTFPGAFFPIWSSIDPALVAPGQKTLEQRAEIDRIAVDFAAQVTHIKIEFPRRDPLQIETGSMSEPVASLRRCVDRLVAGWGLEPGRYWTLAREATPLPETVKAASDALSALSVPRGITSIPVRVRIDKSGQATECIVQIAFSARVTNLICAGLMGRYTPALDAEGHPVASLYITSMYLYGG